MLTPHAWGIGGIERSTRALLWALADLYGAERVALLSVWGGTRRVGETAQWRALEEFSFERFRRRLGELVARVRSGA